MAKKRARGWLVLLGGALALAGFAASAQGDGKTTAALEQLKKMEGMAGGDAITYRDVDGKTMTRADFVAAMTQKHLSFGMQLYPPKHAATFSLVPGNPAQAKEPTADTNLDQLLKMQGVDSSYTVTYLGVDGQVMTRKDFDAVAFKKGMPMTMGIKIYPAKHTAVVSLNAADSVASKEAKIQEAAYAKAGTRGKAPKVGQPLPAFRLTDLDGHVFDNAALRGHVTLMNFFFATCVPCIQETPALTEYAKAHPQMHVLAVTFDDTGTARDYVAAHHFGWPVLANGMDFILAMGVSAYPQLALVDANGRLLAIRPSDSIRKGGGTITPQDIDRWVNGVLAKQSAK